MHKSVYTDTIAEAALAEIKGEAGYENYIRKLNLIIDKSNKLLAYAGKKHNKENAL